MDTLRIAWLFPDTLYLHGERGNILALEAMADAAGLQVQTDKVDFDTKNFDPMHYHIIFCPPGEIASFPAVLEWLSPFKEQLASFVNSKRPLIATGTSVALWCRKINRTDGSEFEGMELIRAEAVEKSEVYGDDLYYGCTYHEKTMELIGNQIQMVDFINLGEQPWGKLIYGYGNTGKDLEEGFIVENSIFTNTLGPLLAIHPELTEQIIRAAAKAGRLQMKDPVYDRELAKKSFATKKEFIMTKETRLTNCKGR